MGKEVKLFDSSRCGTEGRPNDNCPNRKPENNIPKMCKACISDPNIWKLDPEEQPIMYALFKKGFSMEQAVAAETMITKVTNEQSAY
jgi:hypothetical protein